MRVVIKITHLGPTAYRGTRWKVERIGFRKKIYPRRMELEAEYDVLRVARMYASEHGLPEPTEVCILDADKYVAI